MLLNYMYVMLKCNNILNDLDFLETFFVYMHSSLQRLWPPLVFCFHFEVLCKSINSELNANEINLHISYSATLVQLMFISFNTIYPE